MKCSKLVIFVTICFCANQILAKTASDGSTSGSVGDSALVISGGISLGVYEAGLNHVIAELSNAQHSKEPPNKLSDLKVITGSSAGGINAIATAIKTCLKPKEAHNHLFDNLFRDIWINIDLQELLPKEFTNYEHITLGGIYPNGKVEQLPDAILSRKPFEIVIETLRQLVEDHEARECDLLVGLMVTKPSPDKVYLELSDGSRKSIDNQSYAIPIKVSSKQNENGKNRITFERVSIDELKNVNKREIPRSFINLPSIEREITFDSVLRAALASSAFPGAFGPVELGYCQKKLENNKADTNDKFCEPGEGFKKGVFIDGGYFNNVPIGLAAELMMLMHANKKPKKIPSFYYLAPNNSKKEEHSNTKETEVKLTIDNQLNYVLPGLNTLRMQDIHSDLTAYFKRQDDKAVNSDIRSYLPTIRSPYLAGNFLGAFGAFFDPAFREYDYAAGIYDGLMFVATKICNEKKTRQYGCESKEFEESLNLIMTLNITTENYDKEVSDQKLSDLKALIGGFLCDDFGTNTGTECNGVDTNWKYLIQEYFNGDYRSNSYAVYTSLDKETYNNFPEFLAKLKDKRKATVNGAPVLQFGDQLNYMLTRSKYWDSLVLKRVLNRLVVLEKNNQGTKQQLIKTASIFVPKDLYAPYSIGNAKDPELFDWWYKLTPDQFGIDAVQTGLIIGWAGVPNWDHILPGNSNLELGFSYHHQIKDESRNRVNFVSTWAGLRWNRPQTFWSSYGLALTLNRNVSNKSQYGNSPMLGLEGNMSFLSDKIRFSIATRDMISNYEGEDWSVRLSFTNIDELIWAFGE